MYTEKTKSVLVLIFFFAAVSVFAQNEVRVKDIAYIQGVRENQLAGFGIVTGLDGNGDSSRSPLLSKVLTNMITSFGVQVDQGDLRSKNCALVMVTADIPAFVRAGDRVTVQVSSVGDAKSLQGGVLLQSNLKAANGEVYAVAQGVIPVSGRSEVKTSAVIPGGAIVEKQVLSEYVAGDSVHIILRYPDFATANSVAEKIKETVPDADVRAVDASLIQVGIPADKKDNPVQFISTLESVTITPDTSGRVVINPRSGVVVVGKHVRIGKVAVSYKGDSISVGGYGLSGQNEKQQFTFKDYTTVEDFVDLLTSVGLKTDAVIEILQAIDRAGALFGRLIIM